MKGNGHKAPATTPPLPKCPTGIQGLDEITGGGLPRGRPTLVCGGAGCGKTLLAAEFLVRGARAVRRAGRFHVLRGDGRGAEEQRRVARIRSGGPGPAQEDRARPRLHRAQRDPGDRRVRPGRVVRPAESRDRFHRRQARGAGHARSAVRRPAQRGHPARRAAPALPLAQGQGRDRRHHGRARARAADAPRAGGIRVRLRHPARSSGPRPDRHAASAGGEVSRRAARHQRVSLPHRRRRASACCPSRRWG